jgi:hypothetical protein
MTKCRGIFIYVNERAPNIGLEWPGMAASSWCQDPGVHCSLLHCTANGSCDLLYCGPWLPRPQHEAGFSSEDDQSKLLAVRMAPSLTFILDLFLYGHSFAATTGFCRPSSTPAPPLQAFERSNTTGAPTDPCAISFHMVNFADEARLPTKRNRQTAIIISR